jgi:MOSC domain-containing protein YiiM
MTYEPWDRVKPARGAAARAAHLGRGELAAGLDEILSSPRERGVLRAVVIRPETDARQSLQRCELSPERGVHGDSWAQGCWMTLPDGHPHPDVQVALMNARTIALIAQEEARWALAGDNLYVDLDLSAANLPPGTRLAVGSAILGITAVPHNGCGKFAERFGVEATRFVNSRAGKRLHLRGIYARIVQPGVITVGDLVAKIQLERPPAEATARRYLRSSPRRCRRPKAPAGLGGGLCLHEPRAARSGTARRSGAKRQRVLRMALRSGRVRAQTGKFPAASPESSYRNALTPSPPGGGYGDRGPRSWRSLLKMRFLPDGPDVPDDLVALQKRGETIFICSPGVSRTIDYHFSVPITHSRHSAP